jgi:hypothetical protein
VDHREVTLVLVDGAGAVLGALPPFPVPSPHRQEVAVLVSGARSRFGASVVVLRLLHDDTYLAQTSTVDLPLAPVPAVLAPHPLRAPYAEVGGPAASLAWAASILGPVSATQIRTWNLSSIWRLTHGSGTAWLKEVPAFFHHEGAVLTWLNDRFPGVAPTVIAVDGGRMLLDDVPGSDRYGAPAADRLPMLAALHRVQRVPPFPGVPRDPFPARIRDVARRYGYPDVLDGLDERLAAVAACGLPDTLVHGDFHPGNVRGSAILDWGDCFVGNPGYDLLRMVEGLPPGAGDGLVAEWCSWWREAVPGSRPERVLDALAPLSALRGAVVYANFLDQIEPSEHVYHRDDVPACLERARAGR